MEFNKSVVTNQGRELMAKLLSKKATTEFTQVAISSTEYQDSQLEELTVLSNIKQTSKAQAYSNNKTTVSATAAINNEGITEGYYINTVGLYATDPDKGEILYSVSTAKVNGYMPPDIGVSKSGFSFTIYTEVGNAEQVDVTVDPSGYANKSDIQILSERITKNEHDSEEKFIPKLSAEKGLFVIKNSEILDLNDAKEPGIYSIPATGVENKPLPNSGSLFVSKDPGGVRQLFQTERTIVIRQFGGIPSKWTDWKEVAFKTNVVNLTEPQSIAGTKNFIERPLVGGIEVATVDQLENEVILNTRAIGLADGVVTLLDSIENYEALRIEYSYQSNSSSAQKIHLKSQSLTFRFSAINIYDDPASKGYDLLESLVDINKNQVKFNYSKVVAYTGAITEEKNWARIDCIIGIRRAPKLYKK